MLKYFLALFFLVVIYNQVVESIKCDCRKKICDKGWHLKGGRCYRFFKQRRTWKSAFYSCWKKGGYLVQISNAREFRVVRRMAKFFWIDGKRVCYASRSKRNFAFAMGIRMLHRPYTSFMRGEPDNRRGNENCLQFYRQFMKDSTCDNKMGYVCEQIDTN